MDGDLDDLVRRVDPDRWLASRFIADPLARADVVALYAFDRELARAPRIASSALVAEIRLTWWSEALDEIYGGARVRGHPVAQALEIAVGRRGLPRETLQGMIDARIESLDQAAFAEPEAMDWADKVGGAASMAAAEILEAGASPHTRLAGRLWGLKLLTESGAVSRAVVAPWIRSTWPRARQAARGMSAAAFPAIAHVPLVRPWSRGVGDSPTMTRLRLLWAVTTGRI